MNNIQNLLCELRICDISSIEQYYPRVRDDDNIQVLRCKRSGVIFLSSSEHIDMRHYEKKEDYQFSNVYDRKSALSISAEDTERRASQFKGYVQNKKWLDVGTGAGGILDHLGMQARSFAAVEPQEIVRKELIGNGYTVYQSTSDVKNEDYEVVTLFHVLEHFTDPIASLKEIRGKMASGGKIIIEVPHANDALLSLYGSQSFKNFTFWSEHLILHTRESLSVFLREAGFTNIVISGFQRYPLANHLFWLSSQKPGGHIEWAFLKTPEIDQAYADMLAVNNMTDTLIAIAHK